MFLGVWIEDNKVILFKRIPWDTTPEQARRWTKERCRIQSAGFCACRYRKLIYRLIRAIRWFLTPAWCVPRVSRILFERLTAGGRCCFLLRWVHSIKLLYLSKGILYLKYQIFVLFAISCWFSIGFNFEKTGRPEYRRKKKPHQRLKKGERKPACSGSRLFDPHGQIYRCTHKNSFAPIV